MQVYKITNKINKKCYIGQTTKTLKERWSRHCSCARKGSENYISRVIRKYGEENFVIETLCHCETYEIMNIMETFMIMVHHTYHAEGGYNLTWGGEDNPMYHDEYRKKVSRSVKKLWKMPENHEKFCNSMKGLKRIPFTIEHKANMSKPKPRKIKRKKLVFKGT